MIEIIIFILAYLLGSIPFALLIGKIGYGIDIREHGSGNLGGTNTFRTLGVKAGLLVTLGDILKGTLATALPFLFLQLFGVETLLHPLIVGAAAVFGHVYPVFAKFKGGKAVATSGGVILFYAPILFFVMLACFFLGLYLTKMVSLSSIITGLVISTYSFFTGDIPLIVIVTILTVFVIYKHKTNIKRIMNKTEPKIKWL
ncbi:MULTISPECIES: glycerol-3-phosphate 1-O-acyltransferase PlsY [Bacillus]|uniref:glycerol-3-phosphate 1-O-acyltransferase PlsY n=1 Tax=Bacillus TaxID=1386 RepID=UPI000BB83ABD|nr:MULTISPECIES: glycerol-3-phosphate 1-O-acyltransferase PlsY [Bacillus]